MAAAAAASSRRSLLAAARRAHRWSTVGCRHGNPPPLLDPPCRKLLSGLIPESRWNPMALLHSRALLTNAAPDDGKYSVFNEDQESQKTNEGTANGRHWVQSNEDQAQDPRSAEEEEAEEVLGDLESLRISMSKLRTSLLIMGTIQILSSAYIFHTGYVAGKLFLRLALFMVVLPLSLALLLPVKRLNEVVKAGEASKLSTLLQVRARAMTSYFRKADLVTSLSALVLLLASMFEMFYSYIASTIVEAGDKLERLAKEDVEKVASISKSQQR